MGVARSAKPGTGGCRVPQGGVLGDHSPGRGSDQSTGPLQPVREPVAGCCQAMGAVHVQTQMPTAPSAVMAEQTLRGLVEYPEQSLTVDVADRDCPHHPLGALATPLLVKAPRPTYSLRNSLPSALERPLRVVSGRRRTFW